MRELPKIVRLLIAAGFGTHLAFSAISAQAQPALSKGANYVEGELLVKFRGGPLSAAATRVKSALKHTVKRDFVHVGWQHIQLPPGLSVDEALSKYKQDQDVLAVEPNYINSTDDPVERPEPLPSQSRAAKDALTPTFPNDPMFSQQWALTKICAPYAWAITNGSTNVVVAIIDSGINYLHEDLAANMWRNPGEIPGNGIDDDGNGYADDVFGIDLVANDSDPMDQPGDGRVYHGTGIASIIGGSGNNGLGVAGICWQVQLLAVRHSTNGISHVSDTITAQDYLIGLKLRGVNLKAVNMSFGGGWYEQPFRDGIAALGDAGVIAVCGAGNSTNNNDINPFYPSSYDPSNIIAVAASDESDRLAYFSNYGVTGVDLAAPGVEIIQAAGPGATSYYRGLGTSYAAPHVVGAVALLAAAHPEWTVAQIKAAILDSVDVLPAFQGKVLSGGRLNVAKALLNAMTNQPPLFIVTPQNIEVTPGASVTLSTSCGGTPIIIYQWYRDGVVVPGETNTLFSLVNVRSNTTVWVQAANTFGSTSSPPVTVSVNSLLGPVVAWGAIQYGQCDVPSDATNVAAVAGGRWHSLALRCDGTLEGWGRNDFGQATYPAEQPKVAAIAGGYNFSMALRSNGTVFVWGDNYYGVTNVPVGLTNVAGIAAGQFHCLALLSNGTVTAWGYNGGGQSSVPGDLTGVMAISGGFQHSVALRSNGTVVAWGWNPNGETNVPAGLSNVIAVAAGAYATMAVKRDGSVVGWGANNYGQQNIPPGLSNVVAVAGYLHFLALKLDGTVVAWGLESTPVGVDPNSGQAIVPEGLSNVVAIASSGRHSLVLVERQISLAIQAQGPNTVLAWPVRAAGWQLLSTTNLTSPVDWQPWAGLHFTNGDVISVPLAPASENRFFRLQGP